MEAAKKQAQEIAKLDALRERLQTALMGEDWPAVVAVCDEMLSADPVKNSAAGVFKYAALAKMGTSEEARRAARAWGDQIIATIYAEDHESLNALAWFIIRPDGILETEEADLPFAMVVAEKAAALTDNSDANILDTLARAYFVNNELTKAVETQKKAVELAPIEAMKQEYQQRLGEYEAAAAAS
jgi:hypothetical protein